MKSPSLVTRINRFIFGYDIFISYSRKDSLDYAYSIAQHFMKKELGYDCYIDQLSNSNPGKKLPANVLSALKKSTALIIIGSEGAKNSIPIGEEVASFKSMKNNNPIIPVDIDGHLFSATWYSEIEGLAVVDEKEESFHGKKASDELLERVHNSLNFTKKSKKLRRTAFAFPAFFLLSILATMFMFRQVAEAKKELVKTTRQIKQEQLQGLVYLSKIYASVNTIQALKYAVKAFKEYSSVDTSQVAEKNLIELYNKNQILIRNQYWTGGRLSPGGKYIYDFQLYYLFNKKQVFFSEISDLSFSEDDEFVFYKSGNDYRICNLPDTLPILRFTTKDSFAFAAFDRNNEAAFIYTIPEGTEAQDQTIQIFDLKKKKIIAATTISRDIIPSGFSYVNGGLILLDSANGANKISYVKGLTSGIKRQLPRDNEKNAIDRNAFFTGDNLILAQSISANTPVKKKNDILDPSKVYKFRVRFLDSSFNVKEDSTYIYSDFIKQGIAYYSFYKNQYLFGLNGAFGAHFLVNTQIRPLPSPVKFNIGTIMKSYQFTKLIGENLILGVGFMNNEYTITVFRLTNKGISEVFSTVQENHPNGNPIEDNFMKSIEISYSEPTRFLTIYDRGEGWCTQYYLEKKSATAAQEIINLIEKEKIFSGVWELYPD